MSNELVAGNWLAVKDGEPAAYVLYSRHYSHRVYKDNRRAVGRNRKLIVGPGEKMVLLTPDYKALFVWRKYKSDNGQEGVTCSVFRNEGAGLSGELIREACDLAWQRWPGARLYTYVDPRKVKSSNPGYCFLMAGWKKCGFTKGGLQILEMCP